MNFLIVVGTRPEAIKLAPVYQALRARSVQVKLAVTAQHRQMLDDVLAAFELRPNFDFNLMEPNQSLTGITTAVLDGLAGVFNTFTPDWLVVQGDTTTTFAAALAAFYRRVPVAHVEAGLRTGNVEAPWPEEMNRRLATVLSKKHFAPTAAARANLLREGVADSQIEVTGNTAIDALLTAVTRLDAQPDLAKRFEQFSEKKPLILVTCHRRESFGEGLEQICAALRKLAARGDVELVYPVHLNPNVNKVVRKRLGATPGIHLLEPLDYLSFVHLMRRSIFILTDSGGVQEEAPTLGKPVLIMRNITERPEGVAAGLGRLVGTTAAGIVKACEILLDRPDELAAMTGKPNPYGDGKAAERIAQSLAGRA